MTDPDLPLEKSLLLEPEDHVPYEVLNPNGVSNLVLVCDHASCRVPLKLGNLGLDQHQLNDHIGWDPGAADVARQLSKLLDAPLLMSGYSRLVIDCNRPPSAWDSIAETSAGVSVPGNRNLDQRERDSRHRELFEPYHQAISQFLDRRAHQQTLLLSVHSFTPVLSGQKRPWPIGVCYGRDSRFAMLMLRALSGSVDGEVGDNQPYAIEDQTDYTIPVHGEGRDLPSIMIEIRQDGLQAASEVASWAGRIADAWLQVKEEALKL